MQITLIALITMTVFLRTEMDYKNPADGAKYMGVPFFGLVNVMFNGLAELKKTIMRLPVFYKQRDAMFFPTWAFSLATFIMRVPVSMIESFVWVIFTYYTVGLAPSFGRYF